MILNQPSYAYGFSLLLMLRVKTVAVRSALNDKFLSFDNLAYYCSFRLLEIPQAWHEMI